MSRSSLASVFIDVGEERQEALRPEPDSPFHILIAGDFSGGAWQKRAPLLIDRDNFEEILERLSPQVSLPIGGGEIAVRFRELDDFHPDRLFASMEPFRRLRDLRARLSNRETFEAAAAEISPAPPEPEQTANVSGADVLRMMMGGGPAAPAARPARNEWEEMIREMVAPYAAPGEDPRQPELIARTDRAIEGQLRAVMSHPRFQAMEAAWRGLWFLVRRLETGENLKIFLLDMPQAEVVSGAGISELRRLLVDNAARTPGAEPWAVVAGLYAFGQEDEAALAALAGVARDAGAPFIAGLAPDVVGLTRAFEKLRRSEAARWIGLALPRFLLRLPYGAKTDSTETFDFEEMPSPPRHESYLWGNPSLACAYLLGEAFSRNNWRMRPGECSEIDGLPMHVYKHDGEPELKPCAEVLLTEDSAELLLESGFMPLVSIKGTGSARLFRFQSVALPLAPLAGRWSS